LTDAEVVKSLLNAEQDENVLPIRFKHQYKKVSEAFLIKEEKLEV